MDCEFEMPIACDLKDGRLHFSATYILRISDLRLSPWLIKLFSKSSMHRVTNMRFKKNKSLY